MDELRKGTWLAHSSKHLSSVTSDCPELGFFEASYQAGKAGNLLARLAADTEEVLPQNKVYAYARAAGLRSTEVTHCLGLLKNQEKLDFTLDSQGKVESAEIYTFSTQDALITTSRVFEELDRTEQENASIIGLEKTFYIPHSEDEILEAFSKAGFTDEGSELTLKLQSALGLIKSAEVGSKKLFYNEYAFSKEPQKVLAALTSVDKRVLRDLQDVQELIQAVPGIPYEQLSQKIPSKSLEMMEGIGLIDVMAVRSPVGQASFVTIPQMQGVGIDKPILSSDVFHKAKTLLNCLRYGQFYSYSNRGKIVDDNMLVKLIQKLIRGEDLRPSTAAGQDYQVLELDGVIETTHHAGTMYTMRLRQKEVGEVVLQMLLYRGALPELDAELMTDLGAAPISRELPEVRRMQLLARRSEEVEAAQGVILSEVRTEGRR